MAVSAAHALTLYKILKARFAPSSVMVFVSNPFEPDTLFIKCVLCTLPFRPAKAVPYLSRKYGQQQKRVSRQNGLEPF